MNIGINGISSWLCNVCGHIWSVCPNYLNGAPLRCALCRTRSWNRDRPDSACELPGAD